MNERLVARLLIGLGLITMSLMRHLGSDWSSSSLLARAGFIIVTIATVVGLALDIRHRREVKRLARSSGGGAV